MYSVSHRSKNALGEWVPCTYSLNDWIVMRGSAKGPHKLPKSKRGDLLHEWKGRIMKFKLGKKGLLAKVQHIYMGKDMRLPPSSNQSTIPSHCKSAFCVIF